MPQTAGAGQNAHESGGIFDDNDCRFTDSKSGGGREVIAQCTHGKLLQIEVKRSGYFPAYWVVDEMTLLQKRDELRRLVWRRMSCHVRRVLQQRFHGDSRRKRSR